MEDTCVTTRGASPSKKPRRWKGPGEKRLESLEASIGDIRSILGTLTNTISTLAEAQAKVGTPPAPTLPTYQKPEQIIANMGKNVAAQVHRPNDIAQGRVTKDLGNPASQRGALLPNTVITLSPDCAKYARYMLGEDGKPAAQGKGVTPAKGVVRNYMYTKRNGERKYKVTIPGFGEEGLTENELVVCST